MLDANTLVTAYEKYSFIRPLSKKEKLLPDVHIYRPSKTATQSGLAGTRHWLLEYERLSGKAIEPLMGWTSSADTLNQICLKFSGKQEAIVFAENNGLTYRVSEPAERSPKYKSYADSFQYKKV